MKSIKKAWLILPGVLILSVAMFYSWRARYASTPAIIVAQDASDIPTLTGSPAQAAYDPYYSRVNVTRGLMFPKTRDGSEGARPH